MAIEELKKVLAERSERERATCCEEKPCNEFANPVGCCARQPSPQEILRDKIERIHCSTAALQILDEVIPWNLLNPGQNRVLAEFFANTTMYSE